MKFPEDVQTEWIKIVKSILNSKLTQFSHTTKIKLFCQTSDNKVLNSILSEHAQEAMIFLVFHSQDTKVCFDIDPWVYVLCCIL